MCLSLIAMCFLMFVCLQEIQRLQEDADKANKHASLLERENQRLEIQVKDLSQQVEQMLLWLNVLFAIYLLIWWCISEVHVEVLFSQSHVHFGCHKSLSDGKSFSLGQCDIYISAYKIRISLAGYEWCCFRIILINILHGKLWCIYIVCLFDWNVLWSVCRTEHRISTPDFDVVSFCQTVFSIM